MSRRRTSARLIAVANEAKHNHDVLVRLHQGLSSIQQSWHLLPDEERERQISSLLLANLPPTIDNAVSEIEHFKLDGKRIVRERVRRMAHAAAEGKELNIQEPTIHPFVFAESPPPDDLLGTDEDREEFEKWNEGKL